MFVTERWIQLMRGGWRIEGEGLKGGGLKGGGKRTEK
jgi:hypothetical protein